MKTRASEILAEIFAGIRDARRPKIIAVFAGTKAEAECAVGHAQAGNTGLPIWVWCGEMGAIAGCDRVFSLADRSEIQAAWPALAIVAWSGAPGAAWKLRPLFTPPFRVLVLNEDGGFFPATPRRIGQHLSRRLRDARVSWQRRAVEETWSALYRSGQHARDLAGVAWSFLYRVGERARDVAGLAWSFLYRTGERARDVARLALSFLYRGGYWFWELMLAVLAFMALATPPLVRILMSRAGSSQIRRVHPAEERSDFIEVRFANRAWPGAAMRRAIGSQADFVVLRREGETQDAGPLLAMARELGAFAVARQCAHSAWRPSIIAKHPFRCLQPGEVTEVRAPWSPLMVIRREWIERLGCPDALTSGAALMLLFWKSSAAGFTSYAMGTGGPVTDEPAMALEDAEFVGRLLSNPKLKRHAGRPFPLSRGNIARAPARQQDFRGKPRVLIVSPYLPFPLSHGGAVRIYNLCRALSEEVDFVFACFREKDETVCYDELQRIFRQVWIVDNDEDNNEKHGDADVPAQVAGYRNTAMGALIRRLCNEGMADLVQLEYTQMAEYRDYTGGVPVILVEHDITFTLHRQLAEAGAGLGSREEYRRWLEFERVALQCANAVWTMSEDDRAVALAHGARRRATEVIPNGVDLARFQPEPKNPGPPRALFVGSFRHLPNLLAFECLREQIMPAVWRSCPEAVLHVIAGPDHARAAERAGRMHLLAPHPRIVLEGFVADVRPAYREADLVVVPLPLSAGTNIKVMEAMACGRAVVTTPAGCQGLDLEDGREIAIAELGGCFAGAMLAFLANRALCEHVGQEARRCVERRFGWDAIAREALGSYRKLLGPARVNAPAQRQH